MRNPLMTYAARWYYRHAYAPTVMHDAAVSVLPAAYHLDTVPWIVTWAGLCQSTALQMIAAHHGIDQPRRHFDFLMGFTYGALERAESGYSTVGGDPEMGLLTAAPYLGLVRRYYTSDDADCYLQGLRHFIAQGYPLRIPLDLGALLDRPDVLPHNEVLVGYDDRGFYYYEPTCWPPAPTAPAYLPAGETGLHVIDERLLAAVRSDARIFSWPWRYACVLFEPGPVQSDLGPVWRQNGEALVGGTRWGQRIGAVATEYMAHELEQHGEHFDPARLQMGLEIGALTRPDHALYLRETFGDQPDLLGAAAQFERAAECYEQTLRAMADGIRSQVSTRQAASGLRDAAAAERTAGQIFLERAAVHQDQQQKVF